MSTTKKDISNTLMRGADSLRDTIDAANYKDYVLPIMFVKYLSDVYAETTEKYINIVQKKHIWTIWNITLSYSITEIREVLIQLLKSKKSIKEICLELKLNYKDYKYIIYDIKRGRTYKDA